MKSMIQHDLNLMRWISFIFNQRLMKIQRPLLVVLLFCISFCLNTGQVDEVLCPIPSYNFKFYSGYLSIPNKNIHYQYFPSQNQKKQDPLIVWLAGDPGESVLLTCYYENGPFTMKYGSTYFSINDYAWNKKANLLFLELPAGTGFTNRTGDLTEDVFVTDALNAIQAFLKKNPYLYGNEIYLSGRGYGGVHVAYLAKQITLYNIIGISSINLKGILVGNPCIGVDQCYPSGSEKYSTYHYQLLYGKGIFQQQDWRRFQQRCSNGQYDSYACYIERKNLDRVFDASKLSIYNINQKCNKSQISQFDYLNSQCQQIDGLNKFLNDVAVRKYWNIIDTNAWVPYGKQIFDQYFGQDQNSYKFYPFLIENGVKIWIYSGDSDSYIPTRGTEKWVEDLAKKLVIPIVHNWQKWWVDDEVGGSILQLRDITLVSVKDGGFRTGIDKPKAMYKIVDAFLSGTPLAQNMK